MLAFLLSCNFFRPRKKLQERGALFEKARENKAFLLAQKSFIKKGFTIFLGGLVKSDSFDEKLEEFSVLLLLRTLALALRRLERTTGLLERRCLVQLFRNGSMWNFSLERWCGV